METKKAQSAPTPNTIKIMTMDLDTIPPGYWNLCAWYRLADSVVCCHVQNHETGAELLANISEEEAVERWRIDL